MSFSVTCMNLTLLKWSDGVVLRALCRKKDGTWNMDYLHLDLHLGWSKNDNDDWVLQASGSNFSKDYDFDKISLKGSILNVGEHTFPLDFFVENQNGYIDWIGLREDVDTTCTNFRLEDDVYMVAHVLGRDGKFHYDRTYLNRHLGNHNGHFVMHKDSYVDTGKDFWLNVREGRATLGGRLLDYKHEYCRSMYVIADGFHNGDGQIVDDEPVSFWDTRGPFFRFLEDIPGLGLWVSGLDKLRGDEAEAQRAFAVCVYHSIVFGTSLVGGLFGGPVGAAMGASLGTCIGLFVEAGIANLVVDDPDMREELTTLTVWRFLKEDIVNTVGALAGEGAGDEIGEVAIKLLGRTALKESVQQSITEGLKELGGEATGSGVETLIDKICDALENDKTIDDVKKRFGDKDNNAVAISHAMVNPPPQYGEKVQSVEKGPNGEVIVKRF